MTGLVEIRRDNEVVVLTINRPAKLNAISIDLAAELTRVISRYENDPAVRCIVITGAGNAFSAGADIATYVHATVEDLIRYQHVCRSLCALIEMHPLPIVAAVNGLALGGGFELVLACDIVVAADHAEFGLPEIHLGLLPGWGGTQRMLHRVGPAVAKEMVFSGRRLPAMDAARLGLVNQLVHEGELGYSVVDHAVKYAAGMCVGSARTAMREIKAVINRGLHSGFDAGLEAERRALIGLLETDESRSRIAAFINRERNP